MPVHTAHAYGRRDGSALLMLQNGYSRQPFLFLVDSLHLRLMYFGFSSLFTGRRGERLSWLGGWGVGGSRVLTHPSRELQARGQLVGAAAVLQLALPEAGTGPAASSCFPHLSLGF